MLRSTMDNGPRVIVALDCETSTEAMAMADALNPGYCRLKVGKELFTHCGPSVVEHLQKKGFEVFLDLKFHDIPHTVARAVKAAAQLGVWMVNVHASGGVRMMSEARNVLEGINGPKPLLIGVTVLTSMSAEDLHELGIELEPKAQVLKLAHLAQSSGLDGVVCSALETIQLKQKLGKDFLLVTPGIRPADSEAGDQRRVVTPEQAVANGSDYLVIGRPITQAEQPALRCKAIAEGIAGDSA